MFLLEWAAVVLSLIGQEFVIRKHRNGFLIWIIANTIWIIIAINNNLYGQMTMFVVYTAYAINGYYRWRN